MARAGESVGIRNPGVSYGICLGIFPDVDPDPHVELQRTTAANGSTIGGVPYQVVGVVDVQSGERALQYRDALPADNKTYWYRARNIRQNYNASTWTAVVYGTPTNLPSGELPYPKVGCFLTKSTAHVVSYSSLGTLGIIKFGGEVYDDGNISNASSGVFVKLPYPDAYSFNLHVNATVSSHTSTEQISYWVYLATSSGGWRGSVRLDTTASSTAYTKTCDLNMTGKMESRLWAQARYANLTFARSPRATVTFTTGCTFGVTRVAR